MNIAGAIFDMDGTLLDSMPVWDHVGIDYLTGLGIRARPDLPEKILTMSMHQAAAYFRSDYGVPFSEEEIIEGINAQIAAFYQDTAPAKDGAVDFLRALQQRGIKMCVATATDRPLAEAALRRTGLIDAFSYILTCTEVKAGKDRPDIFLEAQKRLGTPRERTLVFEDALYAIQTAKQAGFPVAAVYDESSRADQEQIRAIADYYLPSLSGAEEALL